MLSEVTETTGQEQSTSHVPHFNNYFILHGGSRQRLHALQGLLVNISSLINIAYSNPAFWLEYLVTSTLA